MFSLRILTMALAGTGLAATPAQAQGLLGGAAGAGDCLCSAVSGLLGGVNGPAGHGIGGVAGSITGSVSKTLDVTANRSIDRRNGNVGAGAGLAGTVHSVANGNLGANGLGRSVGLAGSIDNGASIDKTVGIAVQGVGTNHVRSLAGQASGTAKAAASKAISVTRGPGNGAGVSGTLDAAVSKTLSVTGGNGAGAVSGTLDAMASKTLNVTGNGSPAGNQSNGKDSSKGGKGNQAGTASGSASPHQPTASSSGRQASRGKAVGNYPREDPRPYRER